MTRHTEITLYDNREMDSLGGDPSNDMLQWFHFLSLQVVLKYFRVTRIGMP